MDTILPLHPESNKKLLKHSLILYRASFFKVIFLSLILATIVFIPRLLSDALGYDIFMSLPPFHPYRLYFVLVNFIGFIVFIAIIWRMNCVIRGVHEPLIQDFRVGVNKVWRVFIATIIQNAIVLAVLMIVIGLQILFFKMNMLSFQYVLGKLFTAVVFIGQFILILYVSTLFYFLTPLIALENKSILTSLERSVSLVWDHWWRVFSLQITPWLCYLILLMIVRKVLGVNIHIFFIPQGPHSIITTVLNIFLFIFFIPWAAATLLVQLKDLELRKELKNELAAATNQ